MTLATPPATNTGRTHQALYRRWRAQRFGDVVGQEAVVQTLRNAVRMDQVAHALLFVGPRGTGKTSLARIVAKALNCTNLVDGEPDDTCDACVSIREGRALDVIEMDAASNNKVDDIRDFLPRVATVPTSLRRKVFIVDEVQRIKEGWDLLLKTLEEPPDHVAFIFCTTDASQVRPAVLSRIQRFDFRPLTVAQIDGKLRRVLDAEGRQADDDAVDLVARLAAGGMRDAESMLDQLLTAGPERLTAEGIRELLGMVESTTVDQFIAALVARDARTGMRILQDLEDHGRDHRAFLNQVVEALRSALVSAVVDGGRGVRPEALAAAARRLTAIDPSYLGPGGLRFQLELAFLEPVSAPAASAAAAPSDDQRPGARAPSHRSDADQGPTRTSPPATDPPGRATRPTDGPAPADPSRESARPPVAPIDRARPADPHTQVMESAAAVNRGPSAQGAGPASVPRAHQDVPGDEPSEARALASAPLATESADAGLASLVGSWPAVVDWVSQFPAVKPLILACRPIAVDGNVITLGFPESQAFLRDVAERRRQTIEDGVGRILGRTVAVRCVAANLEAIGPDPDARTLLDRAREIFADDLLDIGEVS